MQVVFVYVLGHEGSSARAREYELESAGTAMDAITRRTIVFIDATAMELRSSSDPGASSSL